MIVELCNTDLLSLVNGEQVAIGDLIVRPTEAEKSNVIGLADPPLRTDEREPRRRGSKRHFPNRKTGAHVIPSRFDGNQCAVCTATWDKNEPMIYDYDDRKPYCIKHGIERFPELKSVAAE